MKKTLVLLATLGCAIAAGAADKRILLIAGGPSHGSGDHEFKAGCLLFKKCLDTVPGIKAEVSIGWPQDASVFNGVDAIVIYSDGGGGHPAIQDNRLEQLKSVLDKGAGFGCVHYAVEVPKERGGKEFLRWIGGYFETYWSVNPFWDASFDNLPAHPVTRGVKPFKMRDEWYYHMRFAENMKGVRNCTAATTVTMTVSDMGGFFGSSDNLTSGDSVMAPIRQSGARLQARCHASDRYDSAGAR